MKRIVALLATALVVSVSAQAGPTMEGMMAEMQKCAVCSHMVPHMETLGPHVSSEVVTLNDGMAVVCTVDSADLVKEYHAVGAEMEAAGMEAMKMSDADAAAHLCTRCQAFRNIMAAGGTMHMGNTSMGDIMAVTSEDPAVQAEIAKMEMMWREMVAMMEGVYAEG